MTQRRKAGERHLVLRIMLREHIAARELDVRDVDIQLAGCNAGQTIGHLFSRELCRARDRCGKPAGVVARCDRPCVFRSVDLGVDADILRPQTEHVGNHLRENRAMALPLRDRCDMDAHTTDRIERDGRRRLCAVLRACLAPLGRRQNRRDITHIGDTGLNHRRVSDAVKASRFAFNSASLPSRSPRSNAS